MNTLIDILPNDPIVLKTMLAEQMEWRVKTEASLKAYEALVQALKIKIARLRKQKFGSSSEKIEREIEQLELALEALEVKMAADDKQPEKADPSDIATLETPVVLRRRGKPRIADDTLRESTVLDPGNACPECGGALSMLGQDICEILEFVAAKLKVVETVRLKKACRHCEKIIQAPAPTRLVRRGMAGPALLAHILVAKYDDHLPLYRQGEIFARLGADIPRSTLIDWCGQAVALLVPLTQRIRHHVFACSRLHADDTPIRVLDPSRRLLGPDRGKDRGVKEGRIWTYVRDDRCHNGNDPPMVAYFFSPDRKGQHPQTHLANFTGILQADAYSGFKALYESDIGGKVRIKEAACWAHLRRAFYDVWKATQSTIAFEALNQIGALYDIERQINHQPAVLRLEIRQRQSDPLVCKFHGWMVKQMGSIPGKGDLAKAMRYALGRWPSFTLFIEDGCVAIDNNAAERAIKPVVIGRKNWMFAGSDAGGETLAGTMTIIESTKMSGLNPEAYLADIIARINDHPNRRLDELLPWNWQKTSNIQLKAD